MRTTIHGIDDDGEVWERDVPATYVICPRCEGRGVHDHPAFDNGLTSEDFADDPDFAEAYMSGQYDVPCNECKGERVVLEPELSGLDERDRRAVARHDREEAAYRAEQRAEQRRCGW